jgi:predicted TIM-barrel fold metal-dependent hydrolase
MRTKTTLLFIGLFVAASLRALLAEEPALDGRQGRDLLLDRFRPQSMLTVPSHAPQHAKFPVVDVHVHPRIRLHHQPELLDAFVRLMDEQRIAVCVSLDGGLGSTLDEHIAYVWKEHRERFVIFANIDWRGTAAVDDPAAWDCQRPDFARRTVEALEAAKSRGVSGLKIFKDFGLVYRDADGTPLRIDDARWDPIWAACGRLGLPIIIHVADPAAFFLPVDERNERWEELHRHPDWSFADPKYPRREELFAAFLRVVARHRETTFIGAHLGNSPEDLTMLAGWLDENPNLVVEIASRINELGRQPYTARAFLLKYANRVMFGTDGPRSRERLLPYWRHLETYDEYFAYAENPFPPQGLWNIYGIGLPDEVLRQIYHENAVRLIPGVEERLAAWRKREQLKKTNDVHDPVKSPLEREVK